MAINARFNGGADDGTGGDTHSISRSVPASGGFGAGTLDPGDLIVLLAVGGGSPAGLTAPVISDNITGTVGWIKLSDSGAASSEFRSTWWWKLAVGGEDSIKGEWTTPGTQRGIEFVAVRSPGSLTEAYLMLDGVPAFNSPNMELGPVSPSSNGEMYIGGTAMGPHNYTFASIASPPGTHDNNGVGGDGFNGGSHDGVAGIIHINDNVGANLSTDALRYQSQPTETDIWDAWIGLRSGSSPTESLEGEIAVLELAGTLSVVADTHLAGELRVLEISGTLDAEPPLASDLHVLRVRGELGIVGGEIALDGAFSTFSASGRLRASGLLPPIYTPSRVLGCGVYEVLAFTRGGGEILGQVEFDSLTWARELDATSRASLTIDGQSNTGALARCCALLGELNPFEHELGIYREVPGTNVKKRVWSGPITRMRFPSEQAIIEAFDLSGWLTIRSLHENHNFVGVDLMDMWVAWVEDAMSVDNSPGLYPTVLAPSGITGDRLTQITEHSYAADAIAEIATTGLDWTTIDRVMQAGPVLPQPPGPVGGGGLRPLLLDESFRIAPEIIVDGLDGANCWFVNGGGASAALIFGEYGPAFPATPDHVAQPAAPDYAAIELQYGRIEKTVSETRILDQDSIDQAARTRYDLGKRLMPYITGGSLVETAPIPIEQIVPGALCDVQLERACKPVSASMRIRSLAVSANNDGSEDVDIGLEPIGTVA